MRTNGGYFLSSRPPPPLNDAPLGWYFLSRASNPLEFDGIKTFSRVILRKSGRNLSTFP